MKKLILSIIILATVAACGDKNKDYLVKIKTEFGDMTVVLYDETPLHKKNFLELAKSGKYDSTVFHRVIENFMIQGGGFTTDFERKPTQAPIQNEAFNGLKNDRGTIAMARTNMPHSATSQFFINTKQNDFLNFQNKTMRGWGYTVFGKVTSGMNVVDKIESTPTGAKGIFSQDVPEKDIIIQKVEVLSE